MEYTEFKNTYENLSEYARYIIQTIMIKMEHPTEFNENTKLTIKKAMQYLIAESDYYSKASEEIEDYSKSAIFPLLGKLATYDQEEKDFIDKYYIRRDRRHIDNTFEQLTFREKDKRTKMKISIDDLIKSRQNAYEMFSKRQHRPKDIRRSIIFEDLEGILELPENIEKYFIQYSDEYIEKCQDIEWLYTSLSDYNKDVIDFLVHLLGNIEDYRIQNIEPIAPGVDLGKDTSKK